MGVDRRDYIILGYKLPNDIKDNNGNSVEYYEDEKFLPYIEGWEGEDFNLIVDGMSGKYCAFGKVLSEADESEGFDFNDIDYKTLNEKEVEEKFFDVFGFRCEQKVKLLVFSHYS